MTIDATQFVAYITLTPYQRDFFADYVVIYAADRAMVEAAIAYARKAPAGPGAPETTPATTVGTGTTRIVKPKSFAAEVASHMKGTKK